MALSSRLLAAAVCLVALVLVRPAAAEELVVPGSGNNEQLLKLLAQAFNQQQSRHRVVVPPSSGTAGALRDVEAGVTTLGRVGRPLKPDELARGLTYVPMGRDPVAFAAGAGVNVKSLSLAQAYDIYTGKVTDWRELGAKPGPIRAIGREVTDASRQAIQRLHKPFETIAFGENVKVVHLDPQLLELLDRYPGSLGFLNRSALAACKTKINVLALDGVEPTMQNLAAGRYPISLEMGLIHKSSGPGAAGKAFIEFIQSPAGAQLMREQGVATASGRS